MFDLLHSNTTCYNPLDAYPTIPRIPTSPLSTRARDGHL